MFTILIATLFLFLSVSAQNSTVMKATSLKELCSTGCVPASIVTSDVDGYFSFACTRPKEPNDHKHLFGTIEFGEDDGQGGIVKNSNARIAALVHSAFGTFRAVAYPGNPNAVGVNNYAKNCDKDGVFCFSDTSSVCTFELSGKTWNTPCPDLLQTILEVDAA